MDCNTLAMVNKVLAIQAVPIQYCSIYNTAPRSDMAVQSKRDKQKLSPPQSKVDTLGPITSGSRANRRKPRPVPQSQRLLGRHTADDVGNKRLGI